MTWLRKSLIASVGAIGLYALFLGVTHIPFVHAAPACNPPNFFVCPGGYSGPAGDGQWDDGIKLDRTNGPAGGQDAGNALTEPAGQTFSFKIHYNINKKTASNTGVWVRINSSNTQITGWSGGGGLPTLVNNVCGAGGLPPSYCNPPTASDFPNSNLCPMFYYAPLSNYNPGAGPMSGQSYNPGPPRFDPDYGRQVSCASGGQSIIWPNVNSNHNGYEGDFTFSFTIPTTAINPQDITVRAYLATDPGTAPYLTNVYTRSIPQTFKTEPTGFEGFVQSDPNSATGRVLSGVPVNLTDCGSNLLKQVSTDTNGYYQFPVGSATARQNVCIAPAGPFPAAYDGSPYDGYSPGGGYNTHCDVPFSRCAGYNFTMNPQRQPLPSAKSSSPGSGTAIVPGQAMSFNTWAVNPYDNNTGGGAHQAQLDDEIPLNIDPGSVNSVSASLSAWSTGATQNSPPAGWSVAQSFFCDNVNHSFSYGFGPFGRNYTSTYRCGYSPPSGSTPGYVYVIMSNMPAYSQVNLSWAGNAKAGPDVGVFPSNGAYCGGSANFGSASSVLAGCSDFSTGLQGVSNFAYTFIGDDMTQYNSNTTYNPIPGSVSSIGKDTNAQLLDPGAGLTTLGPTYCDAQTPNTAGDPNNRWVYSPSVAGYASAQFTVHVCPDFSHGPVYYNVTDQDNGAYGPNPADLTGGSALDPALRNVTSWDAPGTYGGFILRWGPGQVGNGIRSTNSAATHQLYNFNVNFSDQGDGHKATNAVKACWPQYWNAPSSPGNYNVSCVGTAANPMQIFQQKITYPFVTSSNGDIHAGGGPGTLNGSNTCGTPAGPIEGGQNPGAQGQYFVTASGNLDITSKQKFFNSADGTQSLSYGTVCRPDLVTSTENYASQYPTRVASLGLWGNSIPADQYGAGWDGKVVEATGDVTIPANLVINARFTLLIHNGNLNIGGNVTTSSTTAAGPYGTPVDVSPASFGVVMDSGNIYIDKNVSQLAGFYYAAPTPNTAANGVINTCSGPDGRPTLQAVPGPAYSVSDCSANRLVVQGLMMAYGFRLDRTYSPSVSVSNSADAAEYVQFDDRLYTATPPGFSNLGQTYLPPIYMPQINPRY